MVDWEGSAAATSHSKMETVRNSLANHVSSTGLLPKVEAQESVPHPSQCSTESHQARSNRGVPRCRCCASGLAVLRSSLLTLIVSALSVGLLFLTQRLLCSNPISCSSSTSLHHGCLKIIQTCLPARVAATSRVQVSSPENSTTGLHFDKRICRCREHIHRQRCHQRGSCRRVGERPKVLHSW